MTSALLLLPLLFALPFARRVATLLSTLTAESATKYEAEAAARQSNLDALAQRTAKDMKEQGPVPPGKYGNRMFPSNRLEKRAGQWLVRNGAFLQATCRVSRTTVSRETLHTIEQLLLMVTHAAPQQRAAFTSPGSYQECCTPSAQQVSQAFISFHDLAHSHTDIGRKIDFWRRQNRKPQRSRAMGPSGQYVDMQHAVFARLLQEVDFEAVYAEFT